MLRLNRRIFHTDIPGKSRGSIVLEASLVMPVFVIVLFLFIYMVQMTMLSTQLHTVAANSVRQVSAHMYPIALAVSQRNEGTVQDENGPATISKATSSASYILNFSLSEWAEQYASGLPSPFSDWTRAAAAKGDEPLQHVKNTVVESVLDPAIKPMLRPFLEGTWLKEERLHVNWVNVPDLKTGKNPYFGLEISYELPMRIPLTGRSIVIQARAEERMWIGDTGELGPGGGGNGEGTNGQAAVVLSKPDPAYAGRRARIAAKISPGKRAKLTVYYKSGVSQAKYLGEATADEHGFLQWEWLVGGNTTPGTWSFVIETEDGVQTTETFRVESPKAS